MSTYLDLILDFKNKSLLTEACIPSSICLLMGENVRLGCFLQSHHLIICCKSKSAFVNVCNADYVRVMSKPDSKFSSGRFQKLLTASVSFSGTWFATMDTKSH